MKAAARYRLTPTLAVFAAALAAAWLALLAGFGSGMRWDAPRTPPPLADGRGPMPPVAAPPLADFTPVWQRSLFSPSRTPEAHAASGGSSLGDLQLTGVILTPQLRMALLHDKGSGRELRLRQGERTPDGSLLVVDVEPRSVIIDAAQGRTELKLPAGAPIDAAPAVPAAGAAPAPPAAPGAVPVSRDAPRLPPPTYDASQQERLHKLKAAVLQRRTENVSTPPEGAQ